MPDPDELPTLSGHQIASAQTHLRLELGLLPERFLLPAFIGMVSDEIEQLRAQGRIDTEIAELICTASGANVAAEDIGLHYAPPEARGKPPA